MSLLATVFHLGVAVAATPPLPANGCLASAMPEIAQAATRADSLALAERYIAAPPGGDAQCGALLAGYLLGMSADPAEGAWRERQRAAELIERALRTHGDEPRLYLAMAILLHYRQARTDAIRMLDRALERRDGSEVPLSVRETAVIPYTRGRIHQDFWRDWRSYGQIDQISTGQWRCSRDETPALENLTSSAADFSWLIPVNQLCPDRFAENMGKYFDPRSDMNRDALREMEIAYRAAWDADSSLRVPGEALLAEAVYAADWVAADSLSREFAARYPDDPWAHMYRGLVLHETGSDSLASLAFAAAQPLMPDSLRDALDDIRPLLRPEQQTAYNGLDSAGQREVRVAFWTSLDPLFLTLWNERRLEHMARVATASLLFGGSVSDTVPAWSTVAGQAWIRYGRPLHIWELQSPGGRIVFWDFGPGPDVSFRRGFGYRSYRATDEGMQVVNVLGRMSPQTYVMTTLVDTVVDLDVQVARTLNAESRPQILVYAEWPRGASATSRAGLTLLDLLYFPVAQWRGGKPTRPGLMAELNGMAVGQYSLTVEVWDTVARRLHRLRDTVSTLMPGDSGFTVSDLILASGIEAPESDDPTSRQQLRIVPVYGSTIARGDTLGLVWETYRMGGAPADRQRYQVRIELFDASRQPMLARVLRGVAGGGERRANRVEYESARPVANGRSVEWIELTSDLRIGEYRLVVRIEDRATGVAVTRERMIRVR
jgi:GWxTD domain-containing protein